ncbi:tetratricopeptide repeat protein [Fibrobacter sp.]|uniref:tetratricopeptide repeat protein n=1 Tax=Fibrobacter sp. TaxID=35828 RepID=UPI00388E8375
MIKNFSVFARAVAAFGLLGASLSFAADPRIEQGARFEAKGEYEKALGEYRSILAEDSKNAEAYYAAAGVRLKMKDYSGALANYRLAYKFEPKMSAAYEGAAQVYEALGQKAKADAERAKDPKNAPEPEVTAEQSATPENAPAAEPAKVAEPAAPAAEPAKVAEPVKVSEPTKVQELAAAKAEAKEEPKAVEAKAEPAKEEPKVSDDPFEKGKALLAEGKFKEAAPLWREVLAKQPGHAGAYFYAGVTRYELGEFDKAEFNLKKGLDYKDGGNDANYYLALIYMKTKRTELEKKSLKAYLKKASPAAQFRKSAEDRLAELEAPAAVDTAKAFEQAKVDAQKAVVDSQKVAVDAKKPAADSEKVVAEVAPEAKVESAPVNADEVSIANANMLFKAGSLEAALQMYKSLVEKEVSPDERYFAMLQMGNIYREMRDFHSAVTRYREVVQQFPDSDWATEAERALEDAVWLEKHAADLPRKKR